jgi:hypothetical protein
MAAMDAGDLDAIRDGVRQLCAGFPGTHWWGLGPDGYPTDFVDALN